MSSGDIQLLDYPLSDDEKRACVENLVDFSDYLFGPAKNSSNVYDTTERVFRDLRYFKLSRKKIISDRVEDASLEFTLFLPDNNQPRESIDADGNSLFNYSGQTKELSVTLQQGNLVANHGIGQLVFSEFSDVELCVFAYTVERPVDPAMIGGAVMFSDQVSIVDTFVSI